MNRIFSILTIIVFVTGCATAYQPIDGISGGYTEQYRGENAYRVRFEGNGYTRKDQVQEMAFLRAAELTLEKGFHYFVIVDENTDIKSSVAYMPSTTTYRGSINSVGGFRGSSTTVGGPAMSIEKPSAELYIYLAKDVFSKDFIFNNARDVVANVRPKYKK